MKKVSKFGMLNIWLCVIALAAAIGFGMMACGPIEDEPEPLGNISIIPWDYGNYVGKPLTALYRGSENVKYQWNKDGEIIDDANAKEYTPPEAAEYTVTVSYQGKDPKTSAPITIEDPPDFIDWLGKYKFDGYNASTSSGFDEIVYVTAETFYCYDYQGPVKSNDEYMELSMDKAWVTLAAASFPAMPTGTLAFAATGREGYTLSVKIEDFKGYSNAVNGKSKGGTGDIKIVFGTIASGEKANKKAFVRTNIDGTDFATATGIGIRVFVATDE